MFEKIINLANRDIDYFPKNFFETQTASIKSSILRLIDISHSKYALENFIDDVHNAINDLHSAYLERPGDFLKLIEDITNITTRRLK